MPHDTKGPKYVSSMYRVNNVHTTHIIYKIWHIGICKDTSSMQIANKKLMSIFITFGCKKNHISYKKYLMIFALYFTQSIKKG